MSAGLVFVPGRPFFEMVASFLAATVGMGPVFDPKNPMQLSPEMVAWYRGKIAGDLAIDTAQIQNICTSGALTADFAVTRLCCMLLNSAYQAARHHNDKSPEFEMFRHLRNAASHGNKFHFENLEPRRPTRWRSLTINHTTKGSGNPLHGVECVGHTLSPADVLMLLSDIESRLP